MRFARCLAAACGITLASAIAHADGGTAQQRQLSLQYKVYLGGMNALNLRYDAALAEGRYEMGLHLATEGLAGWMFDWKMTVASHGLVRGGEVVPVRAVSASSWQGKSRANRLSYHPDGTVTAAQEPPRGDEREPVPAALRRGTRDLAGALFSALLAVGETGRCDHHEKVFDGRRRYDLSLEQRGTERLRSSAYSPYAGPALVCRLRVQMIAGHRKGEDSGKRLGAARWATVWLARVFEDAPPVPVRLDYELTLGSLTAHLSAATLTGPDRDRRLAVTE